MVADHCDCSAAATWRLFKSAAKRCNFFLEINCKVVQKLFKSAAKRCKSFSNQLKSCAKTFWNVARLCLLHYPDATIQHFSNLIIATVKKLLFVKLPNHGNHGKTVFLGHCGWLWLLLKLRNCTIFTDCNNLAASSGLDLDRTIFVEWQRTDNIDSTKLKEIVRKCIGFFIQIFLGLLSFKIKYENLSPKTFELQLVC